MFVGLGRVGRFSLIIIQGTYGDCFVNIVLYSLFSHIISIYYSPLRLKHTVASK